MAEIAIEYAAGSRLRSEAETARRLIDSYLGDRSDVDRVTLALQRVRVLRQRRGRPHLCTDPASGSTPWRR